MAEVLGVLGAVAAASQLAEQSLKIANLISDLYFKVRDAPESIRKESLQLEQLSDIVKLIEDNPPLQTDLVDSILRNCAGEAKKLQEILANISTAAGDGKAKKLWRALDGVAKEKRILALFANLEREKSSLVLCINTIDSTLLNIVHKELPMISGKVTSIHDAIQHLTVTSNLTEEQWRDYCLAALFLTDPYIDRNELITTRGQRVHGTCQWITTNQAYASWLASQSQLLWLSGGPGKGKTMLSIFLTEELEKIVAQSENAKLAYFFCDNRNKKRNTAVAMLRGLIFQLIQQHSKLSEHILPVFKIQKEALFSDSSFESLWRIFESMIRDSGIDSVFCVLDGLDECEEHSLEMLTEKLRDFFSKSPTSLKLIAVSRELPECIPRAVSGFSRVRLDPDSDHEVSSDLRKYIIIKVNELSAEKSYPDDLRAYVERTLLERAKGTFLWVGFVIKELRKKAPAEVEDCLKNLPAGLGGMYDRLLLDIRDERRKQIAVSILCWITMAVRPLTLTELGAATNTQQSANLSVEEVIRDHIGFCGYMLTVTGNNVGLVHQSAKDYLLRKDPDPNPQLEFFRIKEKKANSEIARTCFNYLQDVHANNSVQLVERYMKAADTLHMQAFPLLSYAVLYWPEHARYSDSLAEDIFDLSTPFYKRNSPVREAWLTTYWAAKGYQPEPSSFSLLHLASFFGLVPLTQKLLKKGWKSILKFHSHVGKKDSLGRTPLFWATSNGHEAVVRLLLEHKADVNAVADYGGTALQMAAGNGHEAVVRLLLEHKADVDTAYCGETALHVAAKNGYEAVVRLLLEHKADVDTAYCGETALHMAAMNGYEAVVRLLLEHKADVDMYCYGETALHVAAKNGHEAVVRLLLEHKADVDMDCYGETALHVAAENGHEAVVRLLLEKGAELESKDHIGRTPLLSAAEKGHGVVVRLLLTMDGISQNIKYKDNQTMLSQAVANGLKLVTQLLVSKDDIDLNIQDTNGQTPLSWATKNGYEAVVKLLLEKGAELETKDMSYGRTSLSWAAENGHEAVVKLLLEKGAELETKDMSYGRTSLSWAAENGHEAVVKLLLEKGAELETKDMSYGRTSLSWAAENGHEAVVKLLLEKGAELETKDMSYGRTSLSWAAEKGHEAVVKLLLEKGAELETKDRFYGRTPLLRAAEKGHEAVVKLLLEKGAELETKDTRYGWTPLSWAAEKGHETVVKLLLEKGAELETKDMSYGRTPLSWAAEKGHETVVKLLLEKGVELETKDRFYGRTPLLRAAEKGHEAVVKLLLEKGAELETKDTRYGRTPLSWAAEKGHETVVKLLLEKGAELETKDMSYGRTSLLRAAEKGHETVVKLLLEKGAELETKDRFYGRTPLSWAAEKGHKAVVKLLLEKGAKTDPNISWNIAAGCI